MQAVKSKNKFASDSEYSAIIQVDEATKSFMEEIQNDMLEGIEEPISKLEYKVEWLEGEINKHEQGISTTFNSVTAVNQKVEAMPKKMEKLVQASADAQMKKIAELSEDIGSVQSSNNQNVSDICWLKQDVRNLSSADDELASSMKCKDEAISEKLDEIHKILEEMKKEQDSQKKALQISNKKIDSIMKHISLRIKLEE